MRALGVLLLLLTSACTYTQVSYSGASATTSGTSGGLQVQGGRPIALVILGGLLIATAVDGEPPRASFSDWGWRSAPEMKPDRGISEQDCTKPIELTENLRCR
jgi:hypothetical protein